MPISVPTSTLDKFATFGDLLRFLRRRVSLTQMELANAVGYMCIRDGGWSKLEPRKKKTSKREASST